MKSAFRVGLLRDQSGQYFAYSINLEEVVDIGVATQIDELTTALFGDEARTPTATTLGHRDDAAA